MFSGEGRGPHSGVHRWRQQERFRVPVPGADHGGEEVVTEALVGGVVRVAFFV